MPPTKCKRIHSLKRRKPQNTNSIATLNIKFSAHKLPPEIIHMIYKYLEPIDVAKFRFVSKTLAQIGLEYLVPCIHLQLTTASYDRLSAISTHPVISKHVFAIRYDSDFLRGFSEEDFKKPRMTSPEPPPFNQDERTWRSYKRAQLKLKEEREQFESGKLQEAYRVYQRFLEDQYELGKQGFVSSQVTEALLRLPNLHSLETGELWNHDRFLRALQVILGRPSLYRVTATTGDWFWPLEYSFRGMDLGLSAPITSALLFGLGMAKSNIKDILVLCLDWRIFHWPDNAFAMMRSALCKVLHMQIMFCGPRLGGVLAERDLRNFEDCLNKKRPLESLTSCPDLTDLDLTWSEDLSDDMMDLRHLVGQFYWHALTRVKFDNFQITEMALYNFAARHSTTLERLSLSSLTLSEGTWYPTLLRMRGVLRLKEASVLGVFRHNGADNWLMYPDPEWDRSKQPYGKYIEEYLEDHSGQEMRLDVLVRDGHL